MTLDDEKSALRTRARSVRKDAARAAGPGAGDRMAEAGMSIVAQLSLPARSVVAGYWPVGAEADVRPWMMRLASAGLRCALPVVQSRSTPMTFRSWHPGASLVPGAHGTHQPEAQAETLVPDVVLTPLLAYDDAGFRLGQGGGYYDRTLAHLRDRGRVVSIGVALRAQRVGAVPRDGHDQKLDWLVTEVGAVRFS